METSKIHMRPYADEIFAFCHQIFLSAIPSRLLNNCIFSIQTYLKIVKYHCHFHQTELPFPIQIIVIKQLSKQENLWLSRLRSGLSMKEDLEVLVEAYRGKQENPLYSASMDVILRANQEHYQEELEMCDALMELFADKLDERERKGEQKGLALRSIELVCKKLKKQKTEEEIAADLEEELETIQRICRIARAFAPEYSIEDIYQKWKDEKGTQ